MHKTTIAIVVVAIVLLGGVVWKYSGNSPYQAPSSSSGATENLNSVTVQPRPGAPNPTAIVKEFRVTGQNYSFAPSTLTVKKGDTVRIIFQNVDGVHDFRIDEFGVASKRIQAGEEDILQFTAAKTGTFEYYCGVGHHRQMGMRGTLTVEEQAERDSQK